MSQFLRTILANELTLRRRISDPEKLTDSIRSANIDLNPHQVEAAIFAFKSPISRGAILADEVGLGKTIEGGLIINQLWAEGRRKILILVPASLRTQWQDELFKHFELESIVIDGPTYKKLVKSRQKTNPLNEDGIYIASHNFGYHYEIACKEVLWDLVVIDEAHRLRNVYRKGNKVAKKIRETIKNRPKILLTATPMQNNLMELFGLVSFLDERYLGTDYSFKNLYIRPVRNSDSQYEALQDLRNRLMGEYLNDTQHGGVLTRALRSQVQSQGLVHFTQRFCITEDFHPNEDEIELYNLVSEYLRRPVLASTLATQRNMMELIYRKILASSSFAIAGTLSNVANFIAKRLQKEHKQSLKELLKIVEEEELLFRNKWHRQTEPITITEYKEEEVEVANTQTILPGFEDIEISIEELKDEESESDDLGEDELFGDENNKNEEKNTQTITVEDMLQEFRDVLSYYFLAKSIKKNQKSQALLGALKRVYDHAEKMKWPKKAVVFTESRRTQDHLEALLTSQGYNVVLFNGSNASKKARSVFEQWVKQFPKEAAKSSYSINVRKALVWHFRNLDNAALITTEAGAEGLNLQFANIVINYDLPWNPQRIEQRIGRCHRYGQELDVLVVNFINRRNYADERVYELLKEKIKLFGNLFEFSDSILGTEKKQDDGYQVREIALGNLGTGIEFEKRVLELYRSCRTKEEIEKSFKKLQMELFDVIEVKVEDAQRKVIQNFDEEVHRKLKIRQDLLQETLGRYDKKLKKYIQNTFRDNVSFIDEKTFKLNGTTFKLGPIKREDWELKTFEKAHAKHPLLKEFLENEKDKSIKVKVKLAHSEGQARKILEDLIGREGQIIIERMSAKQKTVNNQEESFEELIFSCIIKSESGWQQYSSGAIEHISDLEVTDEIINSARLRDELEDLAINNRKQKEQKKIEENQQYIDRERDQIRRFSKESLMRHEIEMKTKKEEIEKLENQLSASKTLGFHERQEIQDQITKLQKEYFKQQERYLKAEREQFLIQDQMIENLKSSLQLLFTYKRIASIQFEIIK